MRVLVLICLAVATVAVCLCGKKLKYHQPILIGLAVALMVVAFGIIKRDRSHPDLSQTPIYERSVGYALGQAAAEAFPKGGELLVVRLRFDKPWARIKADGYVDGLQQGLRGTSLEIAGVEPESIFPGAYMGLDEPVIPLPELMGLLEEYPDVVGIISFCGFPGVKLGQLPEEVPPLFVAGTHTLRHGQWLQSGRAMAMVVGRPDVEGDVDLSGRTPLSEVFESINYLVTADNLKDVARAMRAPP